MDALAEVSRQWLGTRGAREKAFSVAAFSPAALGGQRVAVLRRDGVVVAFVSLLETTAGRRALASKIVLAAKPAHDAMAIAIFGNGGWRDLDRTIAGILQRRARPPLASTPRAGSGPRARRRRPAPSCRGS
jgi:type IV secretory pathway VirJ component